MNNDFPLLAKILAALRAGDIEPILVGGLALVLLDSRRVTQDIDLLVPNSPENRARVTDAFYDAGCELGTWIDEKGRVSETVTDRNLAVARARNATASAEMYFIHPETRQEIDILLDFPLPASQLMERASAVSISGMQIMVADPSDLLKMKQAAAQDRTEPRDVQDIEFLMNLLKARSST